MKSDEVTIIFPPIKLEEPLAYLRNLRLSYLIEDFFSKNEYEMAEYNTPSSFARTKERIEDSPYGKESKTYIDYNTFATAFGMVRACAKLNVAIYGLKQKYLAEENDRALRLSNYYSANKNSIIGVYWSNTTDEDALKIKNAAIKIKEGIQMYSKKYTVDDFEEMFVNKFKYGVYAICDTFGVETRTITQRAADTGSNIIIHIIALVLFFLIIAFVAQCATGNL